MKKVVFPLISMFLVYRSIELVRVLMVPGIVGLTALLLAFAVNLFITGVFAFVGFVYPTGRLLPDAYYRIHKPQRLRTFCGLLGVAYFRKLLMLAYWGKEKHRKRYFNGRREGLANLEYETRQSEFGHVVAFVVIALVAAIPLWYGSLTAALLIMGINVVGNFYPVLLQRMHRAQLQRMMPKTVAASKA